MIKKVGIDQLKKDSKLLVQYVEVASGLMNRVDKLVFENERLRVGLDAALAAIGRLYLEMADQVESNEKLEAVNEKLQKDVEELCPTVRVK